MKLTAITNPLDAKANSSDMRRTLGATVSAITRRVEDYTESRNLILGSNFASGTVNGWSSIHGTHSVVDSKYEKVINSTAPQARVEKNLTLNETGVFTYTISVKSPKPLTWRELDGVVLVRSDTYTPKSDGEFQTFSVRFENATPGAKSIRAYLSNPEVGDKITIDWEKLERGEKATPWSPAPEDLQAQIEATGEIPALHPLPIDKSISLRLDTTVGTRIFAGDVMIHGDTGRRSVPDLSAGLDLSTSSLHGMHLRRVGNYVTLTARGVWISDQWITEAMPVGFGFTTGEYTPTRGFADVGGTPRVFGNNGSNVRLNFPNPNPEPGTLVSLHTSWYTDLPWPAALPGLPA